MMKLQMRVGGMFWCAPPPPVDWIEMPVVLALSETPVALACDVATLTPAPTLSTNPNSEMLPFVVAPVEKFMLWVWVGSLTPWPWLGSLTAWAWVGSLTPWPCAGICAVISVTVCVPPAAPSTAPSMPEAPAVMRLPGAAPLCPPAVEDIAAQVGKVERGRAFAGAIRGRDEVEQIGVGQARDRLAEGQRERARRRGDAEIRQRHAERDAGRAGQPPQDPLARHIIICGGVGGALPQHAGEKLGRGRRAQRLRAEPVDVQGAGAAVARVRGERDHRAVHVRERVEHLVGGERIGARRARGRDRAS